MNHEWKKSLSEIKTRNWWDLTVVDLERIARLLIGAVPGAWVRRGDNFIRIAGVKFGSDARKLDKELDVLSMEACSILGDGSPERVLRAAAFYHLRFENIHPLCEANGRIGRLILSKQLEQSLCIPAADTLAGLEDSERDYYRLFATNNPPLKFELLLDLLGRVTGIPVPREASVLPASIEPLHPQKGRDIPRRDSGPNPEEALKNPELARQYARRQHVNRGAKAFRRFF